MEEDITEPDPSPDDFAGKNGAYTQSIAILHHALNSMMRKLYEMKISGGNDVEVKGQYPHFVVSRNVTPQDREEPGPPLDWPLMPRFSSAGIKFVPGLVEAYDGSDYMTIYPTVGGIPVDDPSCPPLPINSGGAVIYLKHTFTWLGDSRVITTGIEIVQESIGIKPVNVKPPSAGHGTTVVSGCVAHIFMSSYNSNRSIILDSTGAWYNGADYATKSVIQGNTSNFQRPSATFAA